PGLLVVPVPNEANAVPSLEFKVFLVRRGHGIRRQALDFVMDIHEQRHAHQNTRLCKPLRQPQRGCSPRPMPSVVLPMTSCANIVLAGWNPPARTSRYRRSSSLVLNIPAPPDDVIARSTTRFAPSTAWNLVATIFIGHAAPWSTPSDQSLVMRSMCGPIASISSCIS